MNDMLEFEKWINTYINISYAWIKTDLLKCSRVMCVHKMKY